MLAPQLQAQVLHQLLLCRITEEQHLRHMLAHQALQASTARTRWRPIIRKHSPGSVCNAVRQLAGNSGSADVHQYSLEAAVMLQGASNALRRPGVGRDALHLGGVPPDVHLGDTTLKHVPVTVYLRSSGLATSSASLP